MRSIRTVMPLSSIITGLGLAASVCNAADPKPMTSTVRNDGTLLVNGKPVLPYGFYISTRHTGDIRLKCVEKVHEIGGNVVHIQGPWDEDTRFLDKAVELGVWVVAGHTETEEKLDRVRKFRNHPAIIAWTLYDDANTLTTVEHLRKMNRMVKEIVPHRLTFVPLGTQSKDVPMPSDEFYNSSDIVGWEMYPVASLKAADPTLRATETQMAMVAKAAARNRQPYWILPQTFKWPGSRIPTPAEYRNLCYVGLINGARGVMPWSIYHMVDSLEVQAKKKAEGKPSWEEWYLPDSKDLWKESGVVAKELKELTPLILDGQRVKLTDGTDLTAAAWIKGKETLVVVANLSEKETRSFSLTVPQRKSGEIKSAFAARPSEAKWTDGKLVGQLAPADVQVFRISGK